MKHKINFKELGVLIGLTEKTKPMCLRRAAKLETRTYEYLELRGLSMNELQKFFRTFCDCRRRFRYYENRKLIFLD